MGSGRQPFRLAKVRLVVQAHRALLAETELTVPREQQARRVPTVLRALTVHRVPPEPRAPRGCKAVKVWQARLVQPVPRAH